MTEHDGSQRKADLSRYVGRSRVFARAFSFLTRGPLGGVIFPKFTNRNRAPQENNFPQRLFVSKTKGVHTQPQNKVER